ncbi:translocation/assembly module TamB [Myroides sp. 1354]|uniref:translocation/assembly module TamB n=1 Tax=unclassified Myroides TaxID=2642485 RepID=UPI0025789185|nr:MULTISPECIES: translocation/assembly module TamB [unclassified Myroides]MDM1045819.1 translocation/assembly module TamB [Myroides sp. R163-1]MDM1055726.1 translocation/assembly module TamB [Myroides sp. 1354]MDM1069818.1 translocation/assembly module TamB [Myroides sp. 1372]
MKKLLVKIGKIVGWIVFSILVLLILLIVLVQIPSIQNAIKDKAITFVENKIGTPVQLDRIAISFPKKIVVKGLYLESQEKDTLVYVNHLGVDIGLWGLLNSQVNVNAIDLDGLTAHVHRDTLQRFNFDYIVDAFASEEEKEDTPSSMSVSVGQINLSNIALKFDDQYDGHHVKLKLNQFVTRFRDFDLDQMRFSLPVISSDGLDLVYYKEKQFGERESVLSTQEEPIEEEITPAKPIDLNIGVVELKQTKIDYQSVEDYIQAFLSLDDFKLSLNKLNIEKQQVDIEDITLNKTVAKVRFLAGKENPQTNATPVVKSDSLPNEDQTNIGWNLAIRNLGIQDFNAKYDDDNHKKIPEGLDVNHIGIEALNFSLKDFQYTDAGLNGNLQQFSFKEQSGFNLDNVKAYFQYGQQASFVKNLSVETPNTQFNTTAVFNYSSLDQLKDNLGQLSTDLVISNSHLGLKDAYLLMPDVFKANGLTKLSQEKIKLELVAKGLVNDLNIEKIYVSMLGSTFLNAAGKVRNLPDVAKAYIDFTIKDFQTTAKDIRLIAPPKTLPDNIEIPALISFTGKAKGTQQDIASTFKLKTSLGTIDFDGSFNQRIKNKEKYQANLTIDKLNLGRLIKNDSIGIISLQAKVDGVSFEPTMAQANALIKLDKAEYNGYTYKDIQLDGHLSNGQYAVITHNADPNLDFDLNATGTWTNQALSLQLLADLKKIDLYQLRLNAEPSIVSGRIEVDMPNIMPDSLVGTAIISDLSFNALSRSFKLQPIQFLAEAEASYRKMSLTSQVLDFEMEGDYLLTQLGDAITQTISKYYKISTEDKKEKETAKVNEQRVEKQQYFTYQLQVKNDPIFQKIVPELKEIQPILLGGVYRQKDDFLTIKGEVPALEYGDITIEAITLDVQPKGAALDYKLGIKSISNASYSIKRMVLDGFAQENKLDVNFKLLDKQDKICYLIGAELLSEEKQQQLSMKEGGFILDYIPWTVNPNNKIVLGEKGLYAKDFELGYQNSLIRLASEEEKMNSPLAVNFVNFSIEEITKMIQKDKLLAEGTINGEIHLKDLSADFRFISDIDIANLAVYEIGLGNLHIGVSNQSLSQYAADIVLEGKENRIRLFGVTDVDQQTLDLKLALDKFQMAAIEYFSMGNLSDTQGYLSGELNIGGKYDKPTILGGLDFNSIGLHVNPINADFKDINEKIAFTARGIELDKFSVTDSDGNLLVIDGQILTQTYTDFKFNLDIKAVDFKAVNSTVKDNDMYYGTLLFDSNLKIRGDLNTPKVSGQISIGKKTDFTMVMPQEDPSIADREGIVEFIDEESLRQAELLKYQNDFNQSTLKGMDVSVSIIVDKEATFTMIMDKSSGDKVVLKGEGDIVGGIDPSGKVSLTGRYEFSEGSYDLSFNFMKRKFLVEKGSSITFAGDPTDAILNLTAIYETKTAPIDLLQNQLAALSPTQQNMYKQQLPFQALLMMKGELLKPEISFDIRLKDGVTSASGDVISNTKSRLEQIRANESELNKQVFALLLLNHFIGDNPFESSMGGLSAGTMARQSVNRLLSDQLNNLASNLIQGVELNFNLESTEDFSSGSRENRTDLNVAVSKRLFSDRLKVTVGSSFEVEGNQRQNEQATNIAGDIELEYALSKDGRYLMRVYRKNQYEVALQGQVVETGVGFIITMSYEHFRELFERSKDKRQLKKQIRDEAKKEE